MTRRSDPNPSYWEQYGPFQQVKHELIRCYLNGWYITYEDAFQVIAEPFSDTQTGRLGEVWPSFESGSSRTSRARTRC